MELERFPTLSELVSNQVSIVISKYFSILIDISQLYTSGSMEKGTNCLGFSINHMDEIFVDIDIIYLLSCLTPQLTRVQLQIL